MGRSNGQLAHFRKAKRELALVTRIDEVKEIRDKAEALRVYSKRVGESLEMQNNCAEIKIRAERRAGELLKESGRKKGETNKKIMCHDGTLSPTLKTLGIEPKQSMRWQTIANIPERIFEQHVEETRARAKSVCEKPFYPGLMRCTMRLIIAMRIIHSLLRGSVS